LLRTCFSEAAPTVVIRQAAWRLRMRLSAEDAVMMKAGRDEAGRWRREQAALMSWRAELAKGIAIRCHIENTR